MDRSHPHQCVLGFLRTRLQCLRRVDDGDGHEADGEVPAGGKKKKVTKKTSDYSHEVLKLTPYTRF